MPRFSSKEEQEQYVKTTVATLGALFGQTAETPQSPAPVADEPEPAKELTCFCGKPPSKLVVSEDQLDELVICEDCYRALLTGYSIRAQVRLNNQEGDSTKTNWTHPDYRGHQSYKVPHAQ